MRRRFLAIAKKTSGRVFNPPPPPVGRRLRVEVFDSSLSGENALQPTGSAIGPGTENSDSSHFGIALCQERNSKLCLAIIQTSKTVHLVKTFAVKMNIPFIMNVSLTSTS